MLFGVCSTAAATAAKTVSIAGFNSLYMGATVSVRFDAGNTASAATLNVNGTGAKKIMLNGTNSSTCLAGATCAYVYDGNYWQVTNTPIYGSVATIGSPSAKNVHIDGDGISIRNGSTELTRFSDALVSVGKNSASSTIEMCGGKCNVWYDSKKGAIFGADDSTCLLGGRGKKNTGTRSVMMGLQWFDDLGVGVVQKDATAWVQIKGDIKINDVMMRDFVVEQSLSTLQAGWSWRKWSSGAAECWGQINLGSVTTSSVYGSFYYADIPFVNSPTVFAKIPTIIVNTWSGIGLNFFAVSQLTTTKFAGYFASTRNMTFENPTLLINAKGRWK